MASTKVLMLGCLLLVCAAVSAPRQAKADISCNQVVNSLLPCVSYVAQGGSVPGSCCNGIKSLYGMAQTSPDRRSVCRCLKSAVSSSGFSYSSVNLNRAAGLPAACGVNLPYKISPSTNCDSIK